LKYRISFNSINWEDYRRRFSRWVFVHKRTKDARPYYYNTVR